MSKFKFDLGCVAKDLVTGYTGVIIAKTEWLSGCRRYVLQSQKLHDGKPVESLSVDEEQIELDEIAPRVVIGKPTGGPCPAPTRPKDPRR